MTALAGWTNFYVIVGSSAGALIGLQFVVLTLISELQAGRGMAEGARAFSTPTIVHFAAVLLLSAGLNAPWQGVSGAAVFCALVGVAGTVYAALASGAAHASADRVPPRVRRLAVSCRAATGGVRHTGGVRL